MKLPLKSALLASTMLTAISGSAFAGILTESTDFSDTAPGTSVDFATYQEVDGTVNSFSDPADYFTFTGLTAGDSFTATFYDTSGYTLDFLIGLTTTSVSPNSNSSLTGILAGTDLTIGVEPTYGGGESEGYRVVLSQTSQAVPEPASLALFSVGLAGLAATRKRKRRKG